MGIRGTRGTVGIRGTLGTREPGEPEEPMGTRGTIGTRGTKGTLGTTGIRGTNRNQRNHGNFRNHYKYLPYNVSLMRFMIYDFLHEGIAQNRRVFASLCHLCKIHIRLTEFDNAPLQIQESAMILIHHLNPVADLGGVGGVQMNPPLELVIVTFAVIMITSPVLATTADHTVSHLHL